MLRDRMLADPSFLFKIGTEVCACRHMVLHNYLSCYLIDVG